MSEANNLLEAFNQYLIADGKSLATIESYVGDIAGFMEFILGKGITFTGNLQRFLVTSYRKQLIEREYSVNTINKKINSLQSFNQFLVDAGYCSEQIINLRKDKLRIASGSEKEVDIFTEQEIDKLLFYIADDTKVSRRDRLIVTMLLYTGVRVGELVNIKLKDVDCLSMNLRITWGKGGKQRDIPLKAEVIEAIQDYLEGDRKANKFRESDYLILTNRSGKADKDAINKLLNRIGRELHMNIFPHKFRHTFCSLLISRGIPVTTVAKLAGHAGIQTTASYYINTSSQDKKQAVDML